MSRRGALGAAVAVVSLLLLAGVGAAQPTAPLAATLFFEAPPANVTFDGTTPIRIKLQLKNVSGAEVITIAGFSASDFWRQLIFQLDGVGFITNAATADKHALQSFGTCHYRRGVVVPAIQVVPVEVLPADFALEFTFDDARVHFDLTRSGRYLASATIPFLRYAAGAIIDDCDVEFGATSLLSIGADGAVGREQLSIASNALEFFIQPNDPVAPTTTVAVTPAANAAGWLNQDATATFTAVDDPAGSGVKAITVTLFGPQAGTQTLAGATGTAGITAEGLTTVFFGAEDNAGNREATQSQTVRIDKTAPVVSAPAGVTVMATEAGGARGSAAPALAAFLAGGTATDDLDQAPVRLPPQAGGQNVGDATLFPPGPTTVTFRFQDMAGNVGSANASVTVTTAAGAPAIAAAVVGKGVHSPGIRFYDLRLTNTGGALARGVTLQQLTFKTLLGLGTVRYHTTLSPRLPLALGDLPPGAAKTVRVYLRVPLTVIRFSLTQTGRFQDAAGAAQTFTGTEVLTTVRPIIFGVVVGKGVHAPGVRYYDVRLINLGGPAEAVTLQQLTFKTLIGTGSVTLNTTLSPALPHVVGDLSYGESATVRIFLNVPARVGLFSITERGQLLDDVGATQSFSVTQPVIP